MKLCIASLLAAAPWALAQAPTPGPTPGPTHGPTHAPTPPFVNSTIGPVEVAPDRLYYTDYNGTNVNIYGETCANPARGTGIYPNETIYFNCLQTGYYAGYDFAIGCGTVKGAHTDVVCQAWRNGGNVTAADGLVSTIVQCSGIFEGECKGNSTGCQYNCSANMCEAFYGVQWFEGQNYLNKSYFPPNSTGLVQITPKRLMVNKKVKIYKWRKTSVQNLCFFASRIALCYKNPKFKSWGPFLQCLTLRLKVSVEARWLGSLDYRQIVQGVEGSGLYKGKGKLPKPTKKAKKPAKKPTKKRTI